MSKKLILAAVISMAFVACDNNQQQKSEENTMNSDSTEMPQGAIDMHNAENSLDWMGTYEGTLPCADCEGIKTTIILNEDGTFVSKEEYLNKPNVISESKGAFSWDAGGTNITLAKGENDSTSFMVIEGAILQLDTEGKEITGEMADLYKLMKK